MRRIPDGDLSRERTWSATTPVAIACKLKLDGVATCCEEGASCGPSALIIFLISQSRAQRDRETVQRRRGNEARMKARADSSRGQVSSYGGFTNIEWRKRQGVHAPGEDERHAAREAPQKAHETPLKTRDETSKAAFARRAMRALEDFEQRPFECFHGPGASAERYPGALCLAAESDAS